MAGTSDAQWPKEVRRNAEEVRAHGLVPVVTGTPGGEWVVAVTGAHVRATAVYQYRGGKTRYARGELTIDGKPHDLATPEELRALWDEHEAAPPSAPS